MYSLTKENSKSIKAVYTTDDDVCADASIARKTDFFSMETKLNHDSNLRKTPLETDNSEDLELREADVVCGKDKVAHKNQGNKRYRKLVHLYRDEYQMARKRKDKTRITHEIIENVHEAGGRFLRLEENGTWVEVDLAGIRDKVSHSLRSARNPKFAEAKRRQKQVKESGCRLQLTEEENHHFESLLATQQKLFKSMMEHRDSPAKQPQVSLFELHRQQRNGESDFLSSQSSSGSSTITDNDTDSDDDTPIPVHFR